MNDYAFFTTPTTTVTTGDTIDLTLTDAQTGTSIGFDTENAILPAGKYIVTYSFKGTGDEDGTVEITPFYNGEAQDISARSDILTNEDLEADINGVFAFTANEATNLSFLVTLSGDTTTLSDVLFSFVVQRMS